MTESAASAVASAVVLDTHALVWLLQGSPRLGPQSRAQIEAAAAADRVFVAAISAWEIAMMVAKGRLALDREVGEWVEAALGLPGLRLAPLPPDALRQAHALAARIRRSRADHAPGDGTSIRDMIEEGRH